MLSDNGAEYYNTFDKMIVFFFKDNLLYFRADKIRKKGKMNVVELHPMIVKDCHNLMHLSLSF